MKKFFAGILLTLMLAVSAPITAAEKSVSDVEAFAQYAATWTEDRTAVLDIFFQYRYAESGPEKSTLESQVQQALVVIEERLASADVRPCFETYHQLVTEFVNALLRYFEVVGDNPALAEAQYQYGGILFTSIQGEFEPALLECVGGDGV